MSEDVRNTIVPDDVQCPSTSRSDSQEPPKKGILKRTSLKTQADSKDTVFPLPGHRPSPDRFPDKASTKIPKLSVTWWEKNAVTIIGDTSDENNTDSEQILKDLGNGAASRFNKNGLRQTAILDSEEDSEDMYERDRKHEEIPDDRDEAVSMTSSTGSTSSSVVGRWWTGKDTRSRTANNIHAKKSFCASDVAEVRKWIDNFIEINDLKNELRTALKERDEKDKHLEELRDRINDIELLNMKQASLSDSHRLLLREKETKEAYEKERKQMEMKHAVRVNQLVQETLMARDEITRLNARIKELEYILNRPRIDAETITEACSTSAMFPVPMSPTTQIPIDPNQGTTSSALSPQALSPTSSVSPIHSLPDQMSLSFPSPIAVTSPMSLSMESKFSEQPVYLRQDALNHIQACQNEAFIWRTKAAQLEIVVKDQLLKSSKMENELKLELETSKTECENLKKIIQNPNTSVETVLENESDNLLDGSPVHNSLIVMYSECAVPACMERKKNLIEENNHLLETIDDVNSRISELEHDLTIQKKEYDSKEDQRMRLKLKLEEIMKDLDSKSAEISASNIVVLRLQNEKETMQKAIAYMEERMQVYQNTLMEHDLVISDETAGNWRKGFSDPRYSIMMSKRIQTTLTAEALSRHEDEFQSTKRKLKDLHNEFTANRSDLHGRFEEIEKILLVKTQLVETLSKQLEDTRKDQRSDINAHQTERENYKRSLQEISSIAEKVPILESRVEQLNQEKSKFELRLKTLREEYESGLEDALGEALKKYKEQNNYWKDKIAVYEQQLERAKAGCNEINQLFRDKEEAKLKSKLEKADLEQRLTSSIDHVSQLNNQVNIFYLPSCYMNKSRRDVECEARPRHVSKYVACRPNSKSKSTIIEKGDLFDETEERLKLCQGELATTRRQVHVLQQKLISTMQERADRRLQVRRKIACVVDRPTSADGRPAPTEIEKVEALQTKNAELREKLTAAEEEKANIVRSERKRIQHLVNEFDNVRKELDQEMSRYELEKKWLKSRIRNLEKDNEELQRALESQQSTPPKLSPLDSIQDEEDKLRKTLSEPELGIDDEETSKLRAENVRLTRELERVKDSVHRTASVVSAASRGTACSHISPAFANLADDLNMSFHKYIYIEILEEVMLDWENDEKNNLARDLKRSRQERESMKVRIDRLSQELHSARAELELYRKEIRQSEKESTNNGQLRRSRSVVDLTSDEGDKEEARRWKLKAGTMFRELNSMRAGYKCAMDERRELKIRLAMMRGELELAQCQALERTSHGEVIVHESPAAFRSGSTKEIVSCNIISSRGLSETRKSSVKGDAKDTQQRSRSDQRKRTTSNKEEYEAREQRRRARRKIKKSYNIYIQCTYATAPQSASSSVMSLCHVPSNSDPQLHSMFVAFSFTPCASHNHLVPLQNVDYFMPPMSQNWYEPLAKMTPVERTRGEVDLHRNSARTISLREKIGQLTRDNNALQEEIQMIKAQSASNEHRATSKNKLDNQLSRLESEKKALDEQMKLMLIQIQQKDSLLAERTANHKDIEEKLDIIRRENEMYGRKIRDMEEERREMYLVMFKKGQQAAAMNMKEEKQLDQMTEDRVVLKFLHDAFYYYMMNKGDSKEHLQAIMTILDFSAEQKDEVIKKRGRSH
uniref:GRIP domain-containing protein n=1 Tax=Heterorhabditis bacteriophora TaxID=37862 RepID=A0A1I7XIR9_HETBA